VDEVEDLVESGDGLQDVRAGGRWHRLDLHRDVRVSVCDQVVANLVGELAG
jgi:hypothetical protein